MRAPVRILGGVVLLGIGIGVLTGCTDPSEPVHTASVPLVRPGAPGGGTATASPTPPPVTQADADFMTHMALHHRQGIELAGLAATRAADPEVADIAARIVDGQTGELAYLTGWLDSHDIDLDAHDHELASMPGVLSSTTLDRARTLQGTPFDELFLDAMSTHHSGAIEMARERLAVEGDTSVTRFAQDVIESQSVEIDRMQAALARIRAANP